MDYVPIRKCKKESQLWLGRQNLCDDNREVQQKAVQQGPNLKRIIKAHAIRRKYPHQ